LKPGIVGASRIHVSPAEPPPFHRLEINPGDQLGKISTTPEKWGVDFWWQSVDRKFCGVQRKAFPGDFLSSLNDGRLVRELALMKRFGEVGGFALLVIEGWPEWDGNGDLVSRYSKYTRGRFESFLASIQLLYGVGYFITEDHKHTRDLILSLYKWTQKEEHRSLQIRPTSVSEWKTASHTEQQIHFLQGLPACGPVRAKAVVDHFGHVPVAFTTTAEELQAVPGVGKGTAARWHRFLGGVTRKK
jgi:ERCC4-type nuclease